jgi:hypothetical protein
MNGDMHVSSASAGEAATASTDTADNQEVIAETKRLFMAFPPSEAHPLSRVARLLHSRADAGAKHGTNDFYRAATARPRDARQVVL